MKKNIVIHYDYSNQKESQQLPSSHFYFPNSKQKAQQPKSRSPSPTSQTNQEIQQMLSNRETLLQKQTAYQESRKMAQEVKNSSLLKNIELIAAAQSRQTPCINPTKKRSSKKTDSYDNLKFYSDSFSGLSSATIEPEKKNSKNFLMVVGSSNPSAPQPPAIPSVEVNLIKAAVAS